MADEKDLTHVARTTIQWENARDKYEIIPEGVLCVEFLQSNITKIKIGDGHRYYSQLPYIGNGDLNEYYTKAETDERVLQIMLDNCSMRIKGELDSPTKLPSHAACGDVWFVKSTSESEPKNRYIEYVYSHEHKWEIIGGTPVDIDLSDYAKKEYVDTKISEVNARISSLDHHTHNNKTILDLITAFFTTEEKQKLKELHNYDDTELRELIEAATHTHTNKEILDKITAAYTKADKAKLDSLENYDDTVLKEKIIALEELAHEHLNKSILDRTSAAFTVEYEKKLKWIREYTGATDNDDGIMGMVPPAAAGEQDYVLNGAGEWVPMEGGGGIGDITAGTGIQVTKDSSGSTITVKKQYTTLEYVQSDKTQKIVTDLFFNESDAYDHTYIIELSFYDISTGANDEVFIGMGPYTKKDSWMLFDRGTASSYNETSSWKYCLSDTGGNWTGTNSFRFPNSSDGLKVTRVEASSSNFNQTGDFWNSYSGYGFATGNPTTGPLTIFGAEDTNDVNGVCVIGYIKMIEKDVAGNESLLHHLVPVVDSNGTVGFIDKLTNKFYSTTTGTGLLSGPVTEEIIEVDTEVEVADENSKSYKVSLKPSTDDEIGGVKPGDGLTVDSDGILDVKYSSGLTINLDNELMVKLGEGLSFDDDGSIKVDGSPGGGGSGGGKVYYAGEAIKLTVETYTRLPEEYSELSYVENTSDSYTILDHIPTENTRVIATASSTDTYHDKVLFGVRTTSTSDNFQLWCGNESLKGGFLYGTNGWSSDLNDGYNISKYVSDGKTATFDCSLNGLYINNELIHTVTKKGEPGNWKMGLFAMTKNSTTVYDERRYYGKLYSFSIYESTTLVCELVPAYHKSSATPGLYDVVNDVFYSSITSTAFSFDTNEIDNPVIHTKDYINVKYGNGLTVNDNNELIPDLSDDLSIDDNGKITVNFPDETVYTQGTGIQISDGESGDKIISNLGVLEILESTNKNQFITKIIGEDGTVKEVEVDIDVDSGVSFTTGNGLTLSDENILSVKIGEGLAFDENGKLYNTGSTGDLPIATAETLGGVKIGTGIDVKDDGTISEGILRLTKEQYEAQKGEIDDNTLFMIIDDFEESLPIASETTLGVVKIGEGISIDEDGAISADAGIAFTTGDGLELSDENVLSVKTGKGIGFDDDGNVMENILRLTKDQYEAQKGSIPDNTLFMIIDDFEEEEPLYEIPIATKTTLGGVIIGNGISVDSTGKISVTEVTPYTLPIATTETLGGIMVGDSFIIDSENGTLNVLKLTKADYEDQKGSISEGTLFVITDDYTEPIPTPPTSTYVADVKLKDGDEGILQVIKSDGTMKEIDILGSIQSMIMNCVPDDYESE